MNDMKQPTQNREDRVTRMAFWGTTALAVIDVSICSYFFYVLTQQARTPVTYAAMAVFFLAIFTALTSLVLTLRRYQQLAVKLLFYIIFVIGISAVTLYQGRTLDASLSIVLIAIMVIRWLFSANVPRRPYYIFSIAVFVSMWVIEWINPSWRMQIEAPTLGPLAVIGFALILVAITARPFFGQVRYSVSGKLISAVVIVLVFIAGFEVLFSYRSTRQNLQRESEDVLISYYETYQTRINAESLAAESLAISIAARQDVQELYRSGKRDELYKLLAPMFAQWKERQIVHLYIENPDGTVFLRVHTPEKFGDDITYRGTAKTALAEKRPTSGVEIGPNRLGVRGVAPMYSSDGQFIGLTEVGVDFDESFIESLKQTTQADFTMWVLHEAAAVPNLKPADGVPAAPIEEVFYYAGTNPEILPVSPDVYRSVLETGQPVFQLITRNTPIPSTVYITPLLGYNGKVLGLLQISESYAGHLKLQNSALLTAVVVTMGLAIVALFLLWLLSARVIIQPLKSLAQFATRQMGGEKGLRVSVPNNDEFHQLAETFNALASSVEEERMNLERRVAERTRNLELAAQVGRTVSQVRDLNSMLKDACELILKEFDLYYVQVYLTDPSQTTLKLEAGTGSVGAQLLARGHSLPFDINSINGRAAVEQRTVVIANTAQTFTFRKNALLPETQAEMAVPLIVAGKVVGVLDMQSSKAGMLTEEVLPAFEALAGQLAVAIQNANLLAETEEARAEVEKQARRLVRTRWNEHLDAIHKPEQLGFVFDHNEVVSLADVTESQLPTNGTIVSAPISVTGEELGSLAVELHNEDRRDQTSELLTIVAHQVAQQLENLRILESAERYRYEAEQAVRLQTIEGWQKYMAARPETLGYVYDTKEVRPHSDGHHNAEMFALPLKARDEMIGKLGIQGLTADDQESVELVNAVAERLSAHIENLRLYDQTQSALTQSEKLFDASRRLTQATSLQELMGATVTSMGISEVNRALLTTFDYDEKGDIKQLTIIGNWWNGTGHEVTPVGTRYPLEIIRAMTMFVSPVPVFFSDTLNDSRVDATTMQLVKRLNLRAVAVLPLHLGARQMGALVLEAEEPHHFTQDEIRLFTSLAPQIATIVENKRQFEQAHKQAERETMLNVINQKIQSATSVEAVLQIAARELGHALGAPMTIAQLSMKDRSS